MFQGQAFQSNAFQAGPTGAAGPETITCDKWLTDSPDPAPPRRLSTALVAAIGAVWVPFVDVPLPDATASLVSYAQASPYQAVAAPVLGDVTTANLDKWLTDSPDPAPAKPRPPSSFAEPVLADVVSANLDKWFTDSPRAPRAKPRPPSSLVEAPLAGAANPLAWLTDSPDPAPAKRPQNIGLFAFEFAPAAPAEEVTLDKWLSYSVGPFPTPRRPESVFAWSTFTPAAPGEDVTLDKWLSYSVGPFQAPRHQQSVFVAPVFFDETSLDKWFTESPDPAPAKLRPPAVFIAPVFFDETSVDKWLSESPLPRRAMVLRQQSQPAAPPFVVEVIDPLAWGTDSPQGIRARSGGMRVQLGAFAWSNFTPAAAPEGFIGPDKWLSTYPYPRLQGNKAGRVDTFSVFTAPDREPDPNPPQTDFFTVSGEAVIDRFPFLGVSSPWDVKRRTH